MATHSTRTPRESPEARLERGMAELGAFARRLSPSDLQQLQAMDARYGLAGLKATLANVGMSADALAVLGAQYARGGLGAVGQAVEAEMRAQVHVEAEQEAVAALEQLQPAQWSAAAQVLATGGPQQLAQEAMALGLSPAAAVAVARHLARNGVEQTRQAVSERVQAQAKADAVYAAAQRDFEAAQKNDPRDVFAGRDIHQASLDFYSAHGRALEAAGIGAKPGESPVAWVRRIAQSGDAATVAKVAQAAGTTPEVARGILDTTRTRDGAREVLGRVRASAEAERKGRAFKPEGQTFEQAKRKPDSVDAALRKAVEATGYRDPMEGRPMRAESTIDAAMALADGKAFALTSSGKKHAQRFVERANAPKGDAIDRAMAQASEHLESGGGPVEPYVSTDEGGSIDEAMAAADRHLRSNE